MTISERDKPQRGISLVHKTFIGVVESWRELGFSDNEIRDIFGLPPLSEEETKANDAATEQPQPR